MNMEKKIVHSEFVFCKWWGGMGHWGGEVEKEQQIINIEIFRTYLTFKQETKTSLNCQTF